MLQLIGLRVNIRKISHNGLCQPGLDQLRLLDEGQPVAPGQGVELGKPGGLEHGV